MTTATKPSSVRTAGAIRKLVSRKMYEVKPTIVSTWTTHARLSGARSKDAANTVRGRRG